MTITNILLALALMALCVIAFELRALLKRMETLRDGSRGDREGREPATAGQTINVNLSPIHSGIPGMSQAIVPNPGAGAASGAANVYGLSPGQGDQTSQGTAGDDEPEAAKRARERELSLAKDRADAQATKAALVTATQSGLIAVKCAACGAENSAYRNVCFNCGGSL